MSDSLERLLDERTTSDEALRLFAAVRMTSQEGRAIDLLLAREAVKPLPEALLVAVASALVDRGEETLAARALARAASNPALVLRADLVAGAGDAAAAIALVERVLLRDIDWPGARERHVRWLQALGLRAAPAPSSSTAAATLMTSAPEAPFRLLREAGRGGSGAVYEARDRELDRPVALKVYHRPDRDRGQLLHEARVAVALRGEGIVRVFDVDPEHGWLAMEWAPLGALRSRLHEPVGWWAPGLATALARVHAAGWVHHDVKPANVLLRAPAQPLLTDFGTARPAGEASPPGSLGFVSPERLAGRSSDPRDDVYGFGRVLEEALDATTRERVAGRPEERTWLDLAAACTGPDDARPRDGADLVARIGRR